MTGILAHPFRIRPAGTVVTVEADSDQAYGEHLAVLAGTRLGERLLVPSFGIPDPAFDRQGISAPSIRGAVELYGPPVGIVSVDTIPQPPDRSEVTITWS